MRAANIIAGLAIVLWFGLALVGRELVIGAGYADAEKINGYFAWPMFVVMALLTCAWICNACNRWPWLLGLASAASLLVLFPYFMLFSGGI